MATKLLRKLSHREFEIWQSILPLMEVRKRKGEGNEKTVGFSSDVVFGIGDGL